jgi:hypothetical protein
MSQKKGVAKISRKEEEEDDDDDSRENSSPCRKSLAERKGMWGYNNNLNFTVYSSANCTAVQYPGNSRQ